jgi:hypothetical protein
MSIGHKKKLFKSFTKNCQVLTNFFNAFISVASFKIIISHEQNDSASFT